MTLKRLLIPVNVLCLLFACVKNIYEIPLMDQDFYFQRNLGFKTLRNQRNLPLNKKVKLNEKEKTKSNTHLLSLASCSKSLETQQPINLKNISLTSDIFGALDSAVAAIVCSELYDVCIINYEDQSNVIRQK